MRVWVFNRVTNHAPIMSLLPGGVYSAAGMTAVPNERKFMAIRMANEANEIEDDCIAVSSAVQFTFWIHDQPGNYDNIDAVIRALRAFLTTRGPEKLDPAAFFATSFIKAEYLFTSDDLRDDEMGTVVKFVQFRIVYTP